MLEWLKSILGDSYTEEIDKKVSTEIGKGFVSRTDYNSLNETKKGLEATLNDANKQIEDFKGLDIDGIQKAADDWKVRAEKAESDSRAKLDAMQFDFALDSALSGAKAKNAKAVKALLDMDGLKLNDGEIIGLSQQLDKLKADNDFLFASDKTEPAIVKPTPGVSVTGGDALRAAMGLPPDNI